MRNINSHFTYLLTLLQIWVTFNNTFETDKNEEYYEVILAYYKHLDDVSSQAFEVLRSFLTVDKNLSTETFLFTAFCQYVQQSATTDHRFVKLKGAFSLRGLTRVDHLKCKCSSRVK